MKNSNSIMHAFNITRESDLVGFLNRFCLKYVKNGDVYYVTEDSFNRFLKHHKNFKNAWKEYSDSISDDTE